LQKNVDFGLQDEKFLKKEKTLFLEKDLVGDFVNSLFLGGKDV